MASEDPNRKDEQKSSTSGAMIGLLLGGGGDVDSGLSGRLPQTPDAGPDPKSSSTNTGNQYDTAPPPNITVGPGGKTHVQFSPEVTAAIKAASVATGVPVDVLSRFVAIESNGNPNCGTGSYKGLLQLSEEEFRKYHRPEDGPDNIYDARSNMLAGARKIAADAEQFRKRFGRDPTGAELYLIHQQGFAGACRHWMHPDDPAYINMGIASGRGPDWGKRAIWGNMTERWRRGYRSVEDVTSRDFVKLWEDRYNSFAPSEPEVATAPAAPPAKPVVADTAPSAPRPRSDLKVVASAGAPSPQPSAGRKQPGSNDKGWAGFLGDMGLKWPWTG